MNVTLSRAHSKPVSVRYTTYNGTARAGTDYVSRTGTVWIPAGARTATVTLHIRNDRSREAAERYYVTLGSPSGASLNDAVGQMAIRDND